MGLQNFLDIIPPQLLVMTCGSGVLAVILWAVIFWRRSQRRTAATTDSAPQAAPQPAPEPAANTESASEQSLWRRIYHIFFYTEEEKQAMQAKKQAQQTAQNTATPDAPPPDAAPVMHLWRDVVDGTLLIQIGDDVYHSMAEIRAAGQERRFMTLLRELARLAKEETAPPPAAEVEPPPDPTPPPPAETAPPAPTTAPEPEPLPQPDLATPLPEPPQPSPPPPRRPASSTPEPEPIGSFFCNARKAIRGRDKRDEEDALPAPPSIAEQIETLLQARLLNNADFAGRSLHVLDAEDGGVMIEVDGAYFEAVGDITDDAAREFVQSVIQAWEER